VAALCPSVGDMYDEPGLVAPSSVEGQDRAPAGRTELVEAPPPPSSATVSVGHLRRNGPRSGLNQATLQSQPSPIVNRQPWPLSGLLLLSVAVFVSVTTELLPTGLLPAMSRDLAVSQGRLGLLVTAYALMVAVLAAPIGMATARAGRRSLLTIALVGYAACNAVTAISGTYPLTVAGRLVGGLSHGLFWGLLAGYAGRLVTPDRIGRAVTIASGGGTAAVLVGVPAGTALGVVFGWRTVFGGFAVLSLILAVVCFRLLPRVPGTSRGSATRFRDVVRIPGLVVVVTATGLIMLGHFSFITYVAPYLAQAGVTEAGLAPALLGYGAAGLVGLVLAGLLIDRRLRGAMLAAAIALALTFTALAIGGSRAAIAVSGLTAAGVTLGMLPVFLQAATLRVAPNAGDPASALNASAFNVGIGGGALLGGVTLDHLGAAALPIVAATLTGSGVAAIILGRRVGARTPGSGALIV
jgi:DHA1 family inner membrane transport protein